MYESVTPIVLKRVLEKFGYHLEAADDISWLMEWECGGHLVNIPQTMAMVPTDVLEAMLDSSSDISAEAFNSMAGEVQKSPSGQQPLPGANP
ncbi:MAG: hypothetical protein WB607_04870 [Candidatus Acidiferrum sp.]|jgi:hypothetical protein